MRRSGEATLQKNALANRLTISRGQPQQVKELAHRKEVLRGGPERPPSWPTTMSDTTNHRATRPEQEKEAPKSAKVNQLT